MDINIHSSSCFATIRTHGAELVSLRGITGEEYMWQGDPAYWKGISPTLFPNVGALPGGTTQIQGKEYPLRRHGFARDKEFRVLYQADDRVTFGLASDAETNREYPYSFLFRMTYVITDCALEIIYDVMNTSEQDMYYKIGGHPAFNCPLTDQDQFEHCRLVFEQEENASCPSLNPDTGFLSSSERFPVLENTDTLQLDYSYFDRNDTLVFDSLKSRSVKLESMLTGRGVQVDFDSFDTLAVWSPPQKKAPFLCIEPWCGCAVQYAENTGHFEQERGIQKLAPDSKQSYTMKITLL